MEKIFNVFKNTFPDIAEQVNTYEPYGYLGIKLTLYDGSTLVFDYVNSTLRELTYDNGELSKEDWLEEFGHNLNEIMLVKGITRKELSEQTNISQATISRWINGSACPTLFDIRKVARELNCSVDDLFIHI